MTVAVGAMPNAPDPDNEQSLLANAVYNLFYDTLVAKDPTGNSVPSLALSWTNDSPTSWTFKLRPNVVFHDGEPFNAQAVKYNFDRIRDPVVKASNGTRFTQVDTVTAVDDLTLRVDTKTPFANLLGTLAWLRIKAPKQLAERPVEFASTPAGTGPFQVTEWSQNNRVVLKAAASWHPASKVANIVVRHVPDDATRVASLQAGEVDLAYAVPIEQIDALKNVGLSIVTAPLGQSMVIEMRTVPDSPLKDVRVRKAIAEAIDIEGIIDGLVGGVARKLDGQPGGPDAFGYDPSIKPYPYDPKDAKALLAQAGVPNGFSIDYNTSVGRYLKDKEISEAVASQLAEVGIRVNIQPLESGVYLDRLFSGKMAPMFDIGLTYAPDMDLDNAFRVETTSNPVQQWADPQFDELYQQTTQAMAIDARKTAMQKASAYLHDQVAAVYLFQIPGVYGLGKKANGVSFRPDYSMLLDNLSQ
ncbi:MAG: ABC transporter substrate-binding protein [Chloroflexi bacterium]|nr:ABC transporter substrate-binding protein [Chloroflexota bacterium]